MTECYLRVENPAALCRCDNCGHECRADEVGMISDIDQRLDPGCIAPVGECPKCDCFTYYADEDAPDGTAQATIRALTAERDRLKAYIESVARITETFQRAFAIGRATPHSVCVQTIYCRDGTLVSAFTTEEAARADLAKWCRDNWWPETDHTELDDDETIETYFDGNDEDFYAIDRIMVEG